MLAFVIFTVTFVLALLAAVIYLFPSSKNPSTIPGLQPLSKEDGNFGDIARAGSLHEFLMDLHKQYGPIASFWWGPTYTVSIGDGKLFKEHHSAFDRPPVLFNMFEPLIGPKSIQFANGADGRARRHMFDRCLNPDAIKKYFQPFQEVAYELAKKWDMLLNDDHIPLVQYMFVFALKSVLVACFGEVMKSDKEANLFKGYYDLLWGEMELRLKEPATPEREKAFQEVREKMMAMVQRLLEERKQNPPQHGEELLVDLLLDFTDDVEQQSSDIVTYIIGGLHTTSNLLSWCFYFLATHPDIQDKVYLEIRTVLGDEEVDHTNMGELQYLHQVLQETLRCAVVAPYAARFQDCDTEVGGYKIPKNTPVIHALGVSLQDGAVFPLPEKFDPDRFSPENVKKRPHLAFSPFGFSGKRTCPGYRLSYAGGTVLMTTFLRKFKIQMVDGLVIEPVHGLVTHPSDEIWITLKKR